MTSPDSGQSRSTQTAFAWLGAVVVRLALAALGWWIISEGQIQALAVGLPATVAAAALSLVLAPPTRHFPRPLPLVLFLGYFVSRSIIAGLDVAWRILQPIPRYKPAMSRVPLYIPESGPRWFLADCISLLPGSVCVAFEGDVLVLHRLNHTNDMADVREVEKHVARMFNLQLDIPDE